MSTALSVSMVLTASDGEVVGFGTAVLLWLKGWAYLFGFVLVLVLLKNLFDR